MSDGSGPTPEPATYDSSKRRSGVIAQKVGMTTLWDAWGRQRAATVLLVKDNQVLNCRYEANTKSWMLKIAAFDHPSDRLHTLSHQSLCEYRRFQIHPKVPLLTHSSTHILLFLPTHSLNNSYSYIGLITRSLTYVLTHSITHLHTHTHSTTTTRTNNYTNTQQCTMEFAVSHDALLPTGTPIPVSHIVAGQYVDVQGTTRGKGFQGVMKRHGFGGQPASHGVSLTHRAMGSTGMSTVHPAP